MSVTLFEEHERTIKKVAMYAATRFVYTCPYVELQEMFNICLTVAFEMLPNWVPEKGSLSTYLSRRMFGAMQDHVRAMDHVPRIVRGRHKKIKALREEGYTDEEIMGKLKLSIGTFLEGAELKDSISIDSYYRQKTDKEQSLLQFLEERHESCTDLDFLRELCKGCNKIERLIVICYYYENDTMKEIGERVGLSEASISALHKRLLARLNNKHVRERTLCA